MRHVTIFLLLCSVCLGSAWRSRYAPPAQPPIGVNIKYVGPDDILQTEYDLLKSSKLDGTMGALSATNRRTLILTAGTYTPAATLTLDTDYVDITSVGSAPDSVVITSALTPATVEQTCDTMAFSGLTIGNTSTTASAAYHGLLIDASDNSGSRYYNMIFTHASPAEITGGATRRCPVYSDQELAGIWTLCRGDGYSYRVFKDQDMSATMWFCTAGEFSYMGDNGADNAGTGEITGTFYYCIGGNSSFGGCGQFGSKIASTATFYGCVAGDNSFAMGKECAGTFYDCHAGVNGFGGNYRFDTGFDGSFTGYAEGCSVTGERSFGAGRADGSTTGTLINCRIIITDNGGVDAGFQCTGARFENCHIDQQIANNTDAITLLDSNCVFYNCTILVVEAGSGTPINAGGALNVVAGHCRMNNADNDADGLGANVTQLLTLPWNSTDSDIK